MRDADRSTGDPVAAAFDAQRRVIETAQRSSRQYVDTRRHAARAMVHSLPAQRSAREQTAAFLDAAVDSAFVATRTTVPGGDRALDDLERWVDEERRSAETTQDQWWDLQSAAVRDGAEAYEGFLDATAAALDAGFEAALEGNARLAATARKYATPADDTTLADDTTIPVEDER